MARPQLRAQFFVKRNGEIFKKSRPLTRDERYAIYVRDGGVCQRCKVKCDFGGTDTNPFMEKPGSQVDHIFPISRGGGNEDTNLQLLCVSCNAGKGAD